MVCTCSTTTFNAGNSIDHFLFLDQPSQPATAINTIDKAIFCESLRNNLKVLLYKEHAAIQFLNF